MRSGRKSCRVNLTVLLSFEEKQMTLARAHNRDTVPLTSSLSLTLLGTCSYHLSFSPRWYFSHNFQRTTFAILSCICLYSLWANFLHSQTICFTLSPHYLHKGDSHSLAVNMADDQLHGWSSEPVSGLHKWLLLFGSSSLLFVTSSKFSYMCCSGYFS